MIYHKCYHDRKESQEMPTAKLWRRGGAILRRVDRRRLSFLFDFGCLLLRRHSRRWRERPQTQGQGTSNKHKKKTSTLHSLKCTTPSSNRRGYLLRMRSLCKLRVAKSLSSNDVTFRSLHDRPPTIFIN